MAPAATSNCVAVPVAPPRTTHEALTDSPKEPSHAKVAGTEQDPVQLARGVFFSELEDSLEASEHLKATSALSLGPTWDWSQKSQSTFTGGHKMLKAGLNVHAPALVQYSVLRMDAEGRPLVGPGFWFHPVRRAGETQEQAEQRAMTAPGVTIEPFCPPPGPLGNSSGINKPTSAPTAASKADRKRRHKQERMTLKEQMARKLLPPRAISEPPRPTLARNDNDDTVKRAVTRVSLSSGNHV